MAQKYRMLVLFSAERRRSKTKTLAKSHPLTFQQWVSKIRDSLSLYMAINFLKICSFPKIPASEVSWISSFFEMPNNVLYKRFESPICKTVKK